MKFKLINTFWVLLILIVANSCKKTEVREKTIYTVQGRFNNYNNPTKYDNLKLQLQVFNGGLAGTQITNVATTTISDSGRFFMQYDGDIFPGDFYFFESTGKLPNINVPMYKDYNKEYFLSDSGKVILKCSTNNPLKFGDTLYIEIVKTLEDKYLYVFPFPFNESVIDTLRLLRPTGSSSQPIYWGRNWREIKNAYVEKRYILQKVTGDPFIDEVTINY